MFKRPMAYDHLQANDEIYHLGDIPYLRAMPDKKSPSAIVEPVLDLDFNSSTSLSNSHFAWQSGSVEKLLLIFASILPLLVSTSLLVLIDRRSTGSLLSFISTNRATVQIIVSIVSSTLACLNVYTMTKLLNLATRIHLLRQSLSLTMIKFIGVVATGRLATDLPAVMSIMSVILVLLFAIPNVLWTGALTPILANTTIVENGALHIPCYSVGSNSAWSNSSRLYH